MFPFLIRLLVNALALAAAAWIVPGITVSSQAAAGATGSDTIGVIVAYLAVGLIFGLVNAFVRPIVSLLSLPITCITLGLFAIVVNAGMLMLTSWITSYTPVEFHVDTFFWDAIFGTIIISIVSAVMGWLLPGPQ
ncbi:MAG: phage holin family protein [Arthrobacter sp.]|uniref:phage holin family protein n=1 Tax=Arthrobacter sp. TaxID=1667 RepID=UPI00346DD98D